MPIQAWIGIVILLSSPLWMSVCIFMRFRYYNYMKRNHYDEWWNLISRSREAALTYKNYGDCWVRPFGSFAFTISAWDVGRVYGDPHLNRIKTIIFVVELGGFAAFLAASLLLQSYS